MPSEDFDHSDFDRLQEIGEEHGLKLLKRPYNPLCESYPHPCDTALTRFLKSLSEDDMSRHAIMTARYVFNEGEPMIYRGVEGQRAFLLETINSGKLIRIDCNTHPNIEWMRPEVS